MPSYRQVTDANADMLKKAEIMYRADAENTALTRGVGAGELDREESLKAINQKLNMLREEKAKALEEKEREYNRDTTVLQSLYDNQMKSGIVLEKQDREMSRNNQKIGNIKQDVLTLRRQVEIAQDETWRRNNKLFILKTLFTFLLGIMIPLILLKNEKISTKIASMTVVVMGVLFTLAISWNLFHGRNRNSLRYNLRHWASPKLSDIVDQENEDEINDSVEGKIERERRKEKGETLKFVASLKSDLRNSLKHKQFRKAGEINETLEFLISGLKSGNSFGGFDNLEQLVVFIKAYEEGKKSGKEAQKETLLKQLHELKLRQKTGKGTISNLNKDYTREVKETRAVKSNIKRAKRDKYNIGKSIRKTQRELDSY